jgi:hypothetical protein
MYRRHARSARIFEGFGLSEAFSRGMSGRLASGGFWRLAGMRNHSIALDILAHGCAVHNYRLSLSTNEIVPSTPVRMGRDDNFC